MTERLYYDDAYLTRFDATLVEVAEAGRRVYLDRTAFYPTSGGQPHDIGTLGPARVVDVADEGERVAHVLAEPVTLEPGTRVEGGVDWERRLDHMQQHTGQHILSAVFGDRFGLDTVSVHFGAEHSTLDVAAPEVDDATLLEAERLANEIVRRALPVTVGYEDAAAARGLRKPPPREGRLRIVGIDGVDRSACGGTHVRTTAEAGPILLRGTEKVRGEARIQFLCGERALARARADHAALGRAALAFSAPPDDVPGLVEAQVEQLREFRAAARRLQDELAAFRARELWEATSPDAAGVRVATVRADEGGLDTLKPLAQAFIALPRAVLVAAAEQPPTVLLAASEDSGVQAGTRLREALEPVQGRGGGSARMAQGAVPDAAALEATLRRLTGEVEVENA